MVGESVRTSCYDNRYDNRVWPETWESRAREGKQSEKNLLRNSIRVVHVALCHV